MAIAPTARAAGGRDCWWTGGLYLASPVVLVNTLTIGTEPLFVLLGSLGAFLLVRGLRGDSWRAMAGSGLFVGLACLARPIGVVLVVPGIAACLGASSAGRPCVGWRSRG
ncbi:MAG: glycosyltransferase family 39 protein [Candidatus Eisenbacteria bacterium]|nr:glycosyltransferase family 39 protein [Candidatus Eisenbacteria bacterium]